MENLQEQRAEIARILGEPEVKMASPKWLEVMQQGVVVELHISRWRGKVRLDLSDLGLPAEAEDDLYSHLVSLGYKKLLPKKRTKQGKDISYVDLLDNLESSARKWLVANSYQTHWGRFVPYTMYAGWKEKNEQLRKEYFGLRNEICSCYDDIVNSLKIEYGAMAMAAYRRNAALITGRERLTEREFIDRFIKHVINMVPSAGYIEASFGYETDVSYVPLPSELERDISKARDIRLKEAADRAMISSLESMNDDVMRQARQKKEEMLDNFLLDVTRQIRGTLYEATTEVLASIKRNGKLVGKSSGQLANIVQSVSSLNFYGDRDITAMIAKMQDVLDTPVKDRSVEEVTSSLREIGILTRSSLVALGNAPRAARGLGIPETPTETMVRKARRSLGMNGAPAQAAMVRAKR